MEKLHLVEKFLSLREQVGQIRSIAEGQPDDHAMREIGKISAAILEEL